MSHTYIAYIDESGDDGLRKFRAVGVSGSTHWLGISCCVVRSINDLALVQLRDEIVGNEAGKQRSDLHFADISHQQRIMACQRISRFPLRSITVLSDKTTIESGTYKEKNQLYHYLTSYLIQQISWMARDMRRMSPEGDGRVKIIFSRRGGMNYDDFKTYLEKLKASDSEATRYHWPVIDIEGIEAKYHKELAGLQIADCVASAFTSAVDPDRFGNVETRYANLLRPNCYANEKRYASYGLKIVPGATKNENLPEREEFYKSFGY